MAANEFIRTMSESLAVSGEILSFSAKSRFLCIKLNASIINVFILICFFISANILFAQDETIFEKLYEELSEETSNAPSLDDIEYYRNNKINLLAAKPYQLAALPGISLMDAYNIIDLIKNNENLTIAKIADSLSLAPETELILSACTFMRNPPERSSLFSYRARNFNNLHNISGFENEKFQGDELDFYQRFLVSYNNFNAGFLTNKDAGEKQFADFYSGFAEYRSENLKIIAGDFLPSFGMGGIFWRSFGSRKGADVISPVVLLGNGINPYKSSIDYNYFRGVAAETEFPFGNDISLKLSAFVSKTEKSSTYDSTANQVTSVYITGVYRTEYEIRKKNNLEENAFGGNLQFFAANLSFGLNFLYLDYSKFINSSSTGSFYGQSGIVHSYYIMYEKKKTAFSAELTFDAQNFSMFKAGMQHSINNLKLSLFYRNIDPNFRSPFGYCFGEFSNPSNETGIFSGIFWHFSKKIDFSFYADIFQTKDRTYFVPTKVNGLDLFFESNYKLSAGNLLTLRLRNETKTDKFNSGNKSWVGDKSRSSARVEFSSRLSPYLQTRLRTETSMIDYDGFMPQENGLAVSMEFTIKPAEDIKIGGRYTLYSTDSYDSAIWQFEYAMSGYMTTSSLYGEGARYYLYIDFSPISYVNLLLRYSETSKNNVKSLSSGYNEIEGNSASQLSFQIDVKF